MSRTKGIILACIICYVLEICSAIKEKKFVDDKYFRICPVNSDYGQPTDICRKVANKSGMFTGDTDIISGECKEVGVNLEDNKGNPTRISFEIVFCDFGENNYDACASASKKKGVIEYFKYLPNRHNFHRCIHQGSFKL